MATPYAASRYVLDHLLPHDWRASNEELSLDEIAHVTAAPLSTVKSRLYRGLAALKPRLEAMTRQQEVQ